MHPIKSLSDFSKSIKRVSLFETFWKNSHTNCWNKFYSKIQGRKNLSLVPSPIGIFYNKFFTPIFLIFFLNFKIRCKKSKIFGVKKSKNFGVKKNKNCDVKKKKFWCKKIGVTISFFSVEFFGEFFSNFAAPWGLVLRILSSKNADNYIFSCP